MFTFFDSTPKQRYDSNWLHILLHGDKHSYWMERLDSNGFMRKGEIACLVESLYMGIFGTGGSVPNK